MNAAFSSRGWAVVTGASSGIGRAFAVELASRGYRVLAVARRKEQLDSLVQQIQTAGGIAVARVADLRTREGVAAVSQEAARLGNVELLVNNAAVASGGNFGTSPLESELGSIQLNTESLVSITHFLLPQMIANRKGAIVNIASTVAFQAFPHFAVYAATKAFVLSFTEAISEELRGTGVRALAVCPGPVKTEMHFFERNTGLLGALPSLTPNQVVRAALRSLEAGRVVTIVGFVNRALAFFNRLMPRFVMRRIMAVIAHPPPSDLASAGLQA
jgi:uncharacterized protein